MAYRADCGQELFTVCDEGGIGWVGSAKGVGKARLDEGTYRVEFLPRAEEGLANLFEFVTEGVNKGGNLSNVRDQPNGDSKVAVVLFFGK